MADLVLGGNLTLMGNLNLVGDGGKVLIGSAEVLVEGTSPTNGAQGTSPAPVIQPPPPASPLDPGTSVYLVSSFNKTVKANDKAIVALGIVLQGNTPMWPGMMLPSTNNTEIVTIAGVPANVKNDQATIFPSGGVATFDGASGQ
jgi:hypothetical protein